jgi:hypothetical protein
MSKSKFKGAEKEEVDNNYNNIDSSSDDANAESDDAISLVEGL